MSNNNIIRVAIGGQGRSGYNIHAKQLNQMPDKFKIVAVADQLPERRRDAREQFGAEAYEDWQDMIKAGGFDLFVNALHQPLHPVASIAALQAGGHVVCEKPTCKTVAQFDDIVQTARDNNRVFAPFQNNRLQPYFDKIQEIINSGVLGKIVYIRSSWGGFSRRWDWQTRQDNWGGGLLNTGPHPVDQALCLFGFDRTPSVFARMDCNNPFDGDADDHCTVTLYDPERQAPQIDIVVSNYLHYPQNDTYTINGTYGGLTGGSSALKWRYFDPEKAPKHDMWTWSVNRQYTREELDWTEETWTLEEEKKNNSSPSVSLESGPERFYNNIYDVLKTNGELLITPAQVRTQIAVIEESHRQNPLPKK